MSVSPVDAGLSFLLTTHGFYGTIALSGIIALYLFVLNYCFGTFSLRKATEQYKRNVDIKKQYTDLFSTRDNIMFHIGWTKSRGEMEDAKRLMRQLRDVDQVRTTNMMQDLYVPFTNECL